MTILLVELLKRNIFNSKVVKVYLDPYFQGFNRLIDNVKEKHLFRCHRNQQNKLSLKICQNMLFASPLMTYYGFN